MERNYIRWAADMRSHGWEVTSDASVIGGSPWSASVMLPNVTVAGGRVGVPGSLGWHAERVVLSVGLFQPLSLLVSPEGEQTVRIYAFETGGNGGYDSQAGLTPPRLSSRQGDRSIGRRPIGDEAPSRTRCTGRGGQCASTAC